MAECSSLWHILHIDGLVQERRNSTALAVGLRLSCTNPLKSRTGSILFQVSYIIGCTTIHVLTLKYCENVDILSAIIISSGQGRWQEMIRNQNNKNKIYNVESSWPGAINYTETCRQNDDVTTVPYINRTGLAFGGLKLWWQTTVCTISNCSVFPHEYSMPTLSFYHGSYITTDEICEIAQLISPAKIATHFI